MVQSFIRPYGHGVMAHRFLGAVIATGKDVLIGTYVLIWKDVPIGMEAPIGRMCQKGWMY